jgi:NAD(P)-dependent dehydrogenase (short-subunit alcohol dehydrogenase family)
MSGVIVNVPQCQASYNSTKAAVIHLTKSLAVEWARHGIRVNAVSPGFMDTPMARPYFEDPKLGGMWMERVPLGRPGRPEELGPLVVFLASEGSSYMTGANVVVDGGYTCE